jgi:NAD(P)-dependent dehydrogenase (short-subunit alcohol dehydrogenase family)
VCNAGMTGPFGPVHEVDLTEWWRVQEVHVLGTVRFVQAVLPSMMANGGGRIIAVASAAGTHAVPFLSGYAVSKATQIRLIEHVAAEGREHHVVAFAIHPGTIFTNLSRATLASPEARRWMPRFVSMVERLEPSDPTGDLGKCAAFCRELASGRFDALSGRYLNVDEDLEALQKAADGVRD